MAVALQSAGADSVQATAGSNLVLSYPATISAGSLLLAFVGASVSTAWATTALTGFTRRVTYDAAATAPTGACFYKVATGSETGTLTTTSPGGTSQGKILSYTGVDTTTPFDVADVTDPHGTATTTYTLATQTPTLTGAAAVLHAIGNTNTGTWTSPAGYTDQMNLATPTPKSLVTHLLNLTGGAATGARTITVGSIRGSAAGFILRPSVAVTNPPIHVRSNPARVAIMRASTF